MDSSTQITDDTNTNYQNEAEQQPASKSAFDASSWQTTDSAFLQPSNLAIPKVQRAWDRRPLSPFSRQRLRVGKVWKRPMASLRGKAEGEVVESGRASKRRKARDSIQGALKPVKKMCLSSDFGMAPRVLQWDAVESPVRKIVTRSNAVQEEIVALPEEDDADVADGQCELDVTVEILDEDGTVLDIGGEELERGQEWEDEETVEDEKQVEVTLPHSDDARHDAMEQIDANVEEPSAAVAVQQQSSEEPTNEAVGQDTDSQMDSNSPNQADTAPQNTLGSAPQAIVLPEGFVSPAKRRIAKCRTSRKSLNDRRRTLPFQFAPFAVAEETTILPEEPSAVRESTATESEMVDAVEDPILDPAIQADLEVGGTEDAWEDVEDEAPDQMELEVETQVSVVQQIDAHTEPKLLSSPIPTIEGQHPQLPLRRSPRRKSSSPLKQSTILPSTDRSHLIAFTPLKGPPTYPSPSTHPGQHNQFVEHEEENSFEPASPLERAASAPPEEPQMSPHKPSRPRVSDDTALLQAFLNRAAEGKSSRQISTAKRESMTNRRDSDAVRLALASPAKAEVLGDLDPNSPSPRKPSGALDNGSVFDGVDLGASVQDEFDEARSGPTTRRGDRAAKRAFSQTPAAPNKIAIRGNAENVFIKRTEAQELALITRNNTRKNKGGAVLPPLRLTRLSSLTNATDVSDSDAEGQAKKTGRKGNIRWAEILVEFNPDGGASESSVLSDEQNGPAASEAATNADGEAIGSALPPSETPSKPKIRRLKPPRTAATPGKAPTAPPPSVETEKLIDVQPEAKEQPKAAPPTKRRSRIATPAKAVKQANLLLDLNPDLPTQIPTADKKSTQKKKAPISKLPAPASASASMLASTSSLGQGKENLISSPPKKRMVPTAKTFAPKLDFGVKTQLQPATGGSSDADAAVPGLASPAKKAKGRGVLFGSVPAPDFGASEKRDEVPGLSSPAKKRTRRAGGV